MPDSANRSDIIQHLLTSHSLELTKTSDTKQAYDTLHAQRWIQL